MQIRFLPEADAELAEARLWYGLQREGLDVSLMKDAVMYYYCLTKP